MMQRPQPRDRLMDGMLPGERKLAVHVMLATGDWPKESRQNLVEHIIAALDEAYEDGIKATLAANDPRTIDVQFTMTAPPDIEAFARAALVFDAGGGP